jgi:hypothetical protein
MPVFYSMNDFVFEDCDCSWVTHWIFNVVQPQHLKYIKSISWNGPLTYDDANHESLPMKDNTFAQMSSIIMLMQLGILGHCKLRLIPAEDYEDYDAHFACILHDKISKLVQRKSLVPEDAEDEKSELDEVEVNGLIYPITKKFSDFCQHLAKDNRLEYRESGLGGDSKWKSNCSCPDFENGAKMSWIDKKSLLGFDGSGIGGSTQDPVVVE